MKQTNQFAEMWKHLESAGDPPRILRNICEIEYSEYEYQVRNQDPKFARSITESFYSGDIYILRNAYPEQFLVKLKSRVMEHSKKSPSTFHKMLEGCPDFHRIQEEHLFGKYTVKAVRHSFYFFNWNEDPLEIREAFYEKWRPIKFMSGRDYDEWENNTPKDGVVDRLQIVKYPSGGGFIESHVHDPINQRIGISIFMSKKGQDYSAGGCNFYDKDEQPVCVEDQVNIGDIGLFHGSLRHGVDRIESDETMLKENGTDGRWWIGLYSPESDELKSRHTP